MSRHVHADLIKEWAEDTSRVVQLRGKGNQEWYDADIATLFTLSDYEWRFKPESKPDCVQEWWISPHSALVSPNFLKCNLKPNIRVTWDGETGKLKSAEVIDG